MRNLIRNDHAKFGEASSIRSGRKVGELNLVTRKKKKERKKIHFLAPKCPISNSHKIQTISNFGVR